MAEHHYLPAVKKTTNLIQPPVSGSWVAVSRREIEALSQGLEVGEGARARGATSVPDVWARALLFHSGIRPKSEHPLHDDLVEEWRGLLSLVALSEYYGLQLQLEPVAIDADRGGRFARALIELSPKSVSLEKGKPYEWLDVLLLRIDDMTVGALSPLTLVYTSVRDLPSSLRLVEGGRLRPPSDATELRYVAQWIEKLRERLQPVMWNGEQNPDHQVVDDISTMLGSWLESLRKSLGLTPTEPLEQLGVEFRIADSPMNTTWGAKLTGYGVYRELVRPAHIERSGSISDLLLKRGRAGGNVVVITPQLLARDVKIWRNLKSRDLGGIDDPEAAIGRYFPSESGDRIERQNLAEANALWIRPEKYFLSDTLLASASEAPLIADSDVVSGQKDRRFVLPFRREILNFFSPQEISSHLDPQFETIDGGFRFTFTLPLDSIVVDKVRVQKEYRYKDPQAGQGTVLRFDPPPVYIFPRYRTRHWRRYFVFAAGATTVIEPLTEPGGEVEKIVRKRVDASIHQLSGESAYPEALSVFAGDSKQAGLVLLGRAGEQPGLAGGREMIIGIDYGTSNTNVFILLPDADQPHPWTIDLSDILQPVFETTNTTRLLQENLLPSKPVQLPIATNLRVFDPTTVEHMLLDYFVFFSEDYRLPDNVYSDIKWQDIAKTQQFIKSLLMLLLLEVVEAGAKRFKIIFSYPKAFSTNQRQRLEQTWEGAIKELTREDNRLLNVADGIDPDLLKPQFVGLEREVEAVAAGEYFASRNEEGKYERITIQSVYDRASVETTAVCIDVGGGTSDICIWHGNERVLDASILLAGRQIGSWMRANGTIRELLFSRDAALALKEVESKPVMFSARLNQILRREEQDIAKNLIIHGTHPEVDRLRVMLALEFGAILFYTATLLIGANRIERLRGNIGRDIARDGINIHWGGNAAKMLRWIDYGKFSEDGIAARTLRAILRNALADAGMESSQNNVGNKQSPGHKSEVAGGLIVWNNVRHLHASKRAARLVDDDLVSEEGDSSGQAGQEGEQLYLGENVETDDGLLKYDEPVSVARLFPANGTTIVRDVTMDRLSRFLKIINQVGLKSGLLDEGKQIQMTDQLRVHVGRQVRGEFVTMASLDPGKRVIEPVFISEVKSLLEVLSHKV
jgi:hypothetical protein